MNNDNTEGLTFSDPWCMPPGELIREVKYWRGFHAETTRQFKLGMDSAFEWLNINLPASSDREALLSELKEWSGKMAEILEEPL